MDYNVPGHGTHPLQYNGSVGGAMDMGGAMSPPASGAQDQRQLHAKHYGDLAISGSAQVQLGDIVIQNYNRFENRKNVYDMLLASLTFEQMDARLRNVEPALPSTCQWVFNHRQFLAWADEDNARHQPFLWIKGKPGSGKSTIMKEMLAWSEMAWSLQTLTLTYFFNARSPDQLEKSGLGLYRCLLHQILTNAPGTRDPFVKTFASKVSESGNVAPWTSAELQNFQTQLIKTACLPSLAILIDALDEGDEDDVRQLTQYLSHLQQHAQEANYSLRIALSSRHYPNITVERSLSIIVEDTPEHDEDIDRYIRYELAHLDGPHFDKLRGRILQRAAGVFLWVVLVIPELKKAYDKGKSFEYLAQKLEEIPLDLNHVFSQIISRDAEDFDKCLKLLGWVLFSVDSLSPDELYCAVEHNAGPNRGLKPGQDYIAKYLLNCSRGLVEVTRGKSRVVQFVHETVRDYLTQESHQNRQQVGFYPMSDMLPLISPQSCHMSIAADCLHYLSDICIKSPFVDGIRHHHPLATYAANNWWRHVRLSGITLDPRLISLATQFLTRSDSISRWIQTCGITCTEENDIFGGIGVAAGEPLLYEDFCRTECEGQGSRETGNETSRGIVPPSYFATCVGIPELFYHVLHQGHSVNVLCEPLGSPLTVASSHGRLEMVQALLDHCADINARGGLYGNALQAASCRGFVEIIQLLLDKGADVNAVGGQYRTAIRGATSMRQEHVVQILLEHGAAVDDPNEHYSALHKAAALGHVGIATLLLTHNADIHKKGRFGNALTLAIEYDRREMVQLLLENGADYNEKMRNGRNALHTACAFENQPLVHMLLDHGADVNILSDAGERISQVASRWNSQSINYVLLEYHQDVRLG